MHDREVILELLKSHPEMFEDAFVTRNTTDDEILKAEKELGFQLPDTYKWYLKEIGHGGCMFEILGFGLTGRAVFVDETMEYRKLGLPENLVIIEKCDEFMYCINLKDYRVVHWSPYDTVRVVDVADDLCQFLYETIIDAIDNY